MTEEEMQEEIAKANAKAAAAETSAAKAKADAERLAGDHKSVQEALSQITKDRDEKAKVLADIEAEEQKEILTREFPQIKDLSVVAGKTIEERREAAKKLYAAMGVKAPEKKPGAEGGKEGEEWEKAGDLPQPSDEEAKAKAKTEELKVGLEAVNKGDAQAALAWSLKQQPQNVKRVVDAMMGGVKS